MRSPAQSVIWQFPLAGGMAQPKDRDEHPDSFLIPSGSTTLYPVIRGASTHYFSFRTVEDSTVKYHLSPRAGSQHKSVELDAASIEAELLEGLSSHLPGRVNAMTLFTRIMSLPEHLHKEAIEHLCRQKMNGTYVDPADLRNALSSMHSTMGPGVVKSMAVHQMAFEMLRTNYDRRPALTADYRKRYPEPWVEEAKRKVMETKPRPQQKPVHTIETEFNFGFD